MTRFLADQERQGWPWTSDSTWVLIYSILVTTLMLAWVSIPA